MNRWRRLIEQEGHARHGLAHAAALVSTEREAEVALVAAGYTATEVDRLIAGAFEDGRYDGCRFPGRIEGASPRTTLDGARDVLAGIDRGARAAAYVELSERPCPSRRHMYIRPITSIVEAPTLAPGDMARALARCHRKPARPWLDAAIFGFPDYPRTLTGYLSASERHVGAAVAASMSHAEGHAAYLRQWDRDVEAHS